MGGPRLCGRFAPPSRFSLRTIRDLGKASLGDPLVDVTEKRTMRPDGWGVSA